MIKKQFASKKLQALAAKDGGTEWYSTSLAEIEAALYDAQDVANAAYGQTAE